MNEPDAFYARSAEAEIANAVKALKKSAVCDGRIESEGGRDIKLNAEFFLSNELGTRLTEGTEFRCFMEEDAGTHGIQTADQVFVR